MLFDTSIIDSLGGVYKYKQKYHDTPAADSPTLRAVAPSETRYKKSYIREIYVARSRNSAGVTGGPPLGESPKLPAPRRAPRARCPRGSKLGRDPEALFPGAKP